MVIKKEVAIEKLNEQIEYIKYLKTMHPDHEKFVKWYKDTEICLKYIYGEKSNQLNDFLNINYSPSFVNLLYDSKGYAYYRNSLNEMKMLLLSYKKEINDFWIDENLLPIKYIENNKNIFIVHGHDINMKKEVNTFIKKINLNPIILHEQPNLGRTIIEKFEDHSNVIYAIALLSKDDMARICKKIFNKINNPLKPRARQNVIFEMGFFIGKLGRNRVCCLYQKGVELPSDYKGVLYIEYDEKGLWKEQLLKEFKELKVIK